MLDCRKEPKIYNSKSLWYLLKNSKNTLLTDKITEWSDKLFLGHCFSLLSFAFNCFSLFTLEVLLDKFSFFHNVSNNSLLTVFCCLVLILYFGDSVPYVIKTSITWICLLGFFFSFLCAEGGTKLSSISPHPISRPRKDMLYNFFVPLARIPLARQRKIY